MVHVMGHSWTNCASMWLVHRMEISSVSFSFKCEPHIAISFWINIGSNNGLLPKGAKPLPKPMLTYHWMISMTLTWKQFHQMRSLTVSVIYIREFPLNSLRPSDAYMRRWTNHYWFRLIAPGWNQGIIWTNAGTLSIGPLGTNVNEISIKFRLFWFSKMYLEMMENGDDFVPVSMY